MTWVNDDTSPHTVTDKGRMFRSAALDTEDRFSYTFANPGEFTYFCTLHPMMVGKIIVKPAGAASLSHVPTAVGEGRPPHCRGIPPCPTTQRR